MLGFLHSLVDTWLWVFPKEFQLGSLVFAEVKACVATDICEAEAEPPPGPGPQTHHTGEDLLSLLDWANKVTNVVGAFDVEEMRTVFRDVQAKFLEVIRGEGEDEGKGEVVDVACRNDLS